MKSIVLSLFLGVCALNSAFASDYCDMLGAEKDTRKRILDQAKRSGYKIENLKVGHVGTQDAAKEKVVLVFFSYNIDGGGSVAGVGDYKKSEYCFGTLLSTGVN